MAPELALSFSVVSVIEDVLQTHGSRLSDIHLASRKAEEACTYPLSRSFPFLISFFSGNVHIQSIDNVGFLPRVNDTFFFCVCVCVFFFKFEIQNLDTLVLFSIRLSFMSLMLICKIKDFIKHQIQVIEVKF